VFYKRKHVDYVPPPPTLPFAPNTEVWEIPQTGEVFDNYEAYLKRRDFYHQRAFACEITGHGNLTFFDALESETQGSRELDSTFPEPLRAPVLKKVQHSTVGRLEQLVNWVYEEFKNDFFPKERVTAVIDGEKLDGTVRDKVTFADRFRPDGSLESPGFSQYFIAVDEDPKKPNQPLESTAYGQHLYRDRRHFSKQILRSFLKNSLTKESWHGAPWQVKENLAQHCRIPTEIPTHLQYHARMAEKKAAALQKKAQEAEGSSSTFFNFLAARQNQRMLDLRPGPNAKGQKNRFILHEFGKPANNQPNHANRSLTSIHVQYGPPGNFQGLGLSPSTQAIINGQLPYTFQPSQHPAIFQAVNTVVGAQPEIVPQPPVIKFPTEDLDVPPRKDGIQRPRLKFFAEELPKDAPKDAEAPSNGVKMRSMGPLLDIWNTLNVHSEVFILDSFTLDDFTEAMRFQSNEVECELLNEVHCAVLKHIVDEKGEVLVSLPDFDEESEEEQEEQEESIEPEPEPEPEPPRRRTRSSFAKAEAVKEKSPTPENKQVHRAAEMLAERPWIDRLKSRDFRNGSWVAIMIGVLHQLSLEERMKPRCEKILSKLAPVDEEPTDDVGVRHYNQLDVNLRIDALHLLVKLTVGTRAIRDHLEAMSAEMTHLRKDKMEHQRKRRD
jgi:ATP-utilising chromatin assembly and remodelling N-terminal/DDT domain